MTFLPDLDAAQDIQIIRGIYRVDERAIAALTDLEARTLHIAFQGCSDRESWVDNMTGWCFYDVTGTVRQVVNLERVLRAAAKAHGSEMVTVKVDVVKDVHNGGGG